MRAGARTVVMLATPGTGGYDLTGPDGRRAGAPISAGANRVSGAQGGPCHASQAL
jgi:hypothetical protein